MSSTPEELMVCAEALLPSASDETQYRSVCSRAYYAAFNAANAFHNNLSTPGTVGNASGRHQQLISQLLNPQISQKNKRYLVSRALGKSLMPLILARVRADYEIQLDVDQALATKTTAGARVVVDAAK
ncbi:hypothetical protein [Paraburkholderia aromaticivorans]|uniref:hypothetical protein n=1 Tax=Paraburkholderia aromaticivorans TaxID=2026199 RepID=UPI0012FD1763|nr:hypothetical protein [Paraburkholderia aromaticivorans]